ncbi:MAG: acyltransferase family protein [Promethearchaeota archaeon]
MLIHIFTYYFQFATTTNPFIEFLDQIVQLAVPIFIFISGFTLSLKYWEEFSILTFYKKRFKKILFPYLFFCFVYIIIPSIIERKPIEFSSEELLNILFDPWEFCYLFWVIALISSF